MNRPGSGGASKKPAAIHFLGPWASTPGLQTAAARRCGVPTTAGSASNGAEGRSLSGPALGQSQPELPPVWLATLSRASASVGLDQLRNALHMGSHREDTDGRERKRDPSSNSPGWGTPDAADVGGEDLGAVSVEVAVGSVVTFGGLCQQRDGGVVRRGHRLVDPTMKFLVASWPDGLRAEHDDKRLGGCPPSTQSEMPICNIAASPDVLDVS